MASDGREGSAKRYLLFETPLELVVPNGLWLPPHGQQLAFAL